MSCEARRRNRFEKHPTRRKRKEAAQRPLLYTPPAKLKLARPKVETSLIQRLNEDLKTALRQGEKVNLETIRLIVSAAKYAEIAEQKKLYDAGADEATVRAKHLSDVDVLGVIAEMVKQHHESIDMFKQGKRDDLVAREEAELGVLESYLPTQMSRAEIIEAARRVIAELGAKSSMETGKVMQRLMPQLKGKADGREISSVVGDS